MDTLTQPAPAGADRIFRIPLIIRGEVIQSEALEFGGRRNNASFRTADVGAHLDRLCLSAPSALADLYELSFENILAFFEALGPRLKLADNPYLQASLELATRVSGLGRDMIRYQYDIFHQACAPEKIREMTDYAVGVPFLEGWVPRPLHNGCVAYVRAFGARAVHIMAGNVPTVSLMTIIRNAVTRSDAILKTPSNDPLTAAAIARTMVDMAPDHPIVKHLSVAYWKGGDAAVESAVYTPHNIEKIIAWGGYASIRHIQQYVQPGIDLITLDPKLSSSIVGRDAFANDDSMRDAATRLAEDIAYYNQEACVNSRVSYVQTGTDQAGIDTAVRFAEMVYAQIQKLPSHASCPAAALNADLREEIEALKLFGDHIVIGGGPEGGVIVSPDGAPVEFAAILANRVANFVPFDEIDTPVRSINAYTQTIGIYPDTLKRDIRDRCVFHGAQRLVSLGYAGRGAHAGPHDGIEPMRRMCKWITDEQYDPAIALPSQR